MDALAATAPAYWGISPETLVGPATGGRLPMGWLGRPQVGPTWLVVGDAAGTINPFNGEGIDYAYETGRMAADVLDEALVDNAGLALQDYQRRLDAEYGLYYRVARAFVHIIGQPALMRADVRPACSRARSWSGCCASWPTCCAPTSSARGGGLQGRRRARSPRVWARLREQHLERARRQRSPFEHGVEARVGLGVSRLGLLKIAWGLVGKEDPDQRFDDGVPARRALRGDHLLQLGRQLGRPPCEHPERAGVSARRGLLGPRSVATGFPDSVPAWYTGPTGASRP